MRSVEQSFFVVWLSNGKSSLVHFINKIFLNNKMVQQERRGKGVASIPAYGSEVQRIPISAFTKECSLYFGLK